MATGITSYGTAIPFLRISVEAIADVWKNTGLDLLKKNLRLTERAVLAPDEDTITLAVAAAREAVDRSGLGRNRFRALYFGTYTNPYDSRPSASILAEMLGFGPNLLCADVQFAGKSGTSAMQIAYAVVKSGLARDALAIGADTINRHCPPGDLYEYTASAGGAAFSIGDNKVIAEIDGMYSTARELTDFFRIEGDRYIKSGMGLGGETWSLGLNHDTALATEGLLKDLGATPKDFKFAVFQQPYGNTAYGAGRGAGFSEEQIDSGVIATKIGDVGSASTMIGLARVLDQANPGDRILVTSYGFGAGSDAIALKVTGEIDRVRTKGTTVDAKIDRKQSVDYATSAKTEYKYLRPEFPLGPNL